MKRQKLTSFICIILVLIMLFSGCNAPQENPSETQATDVSTEASTTKPTDKATDGSERDEPCEEHDYEEESRVDAMALKDGEIKYVCSECGNAATEVIPFNINNPSVSHSLDSSLCTREPLAQKHPALTFYLYSTHRQ